MHPILRSRARLGTYLLGWVPVAALLATQMAVQHIPVFISGVVSFCYAGTASLLFLSSFYICRIMPLDRTPFARVSGTLLGSAIAMGAIWTLLNQGLLQFLGHFNEDIRALATPSAPRFLGNLIVGMIFYLITAALHYLLISQDERRLVEDRSRELQVLAREAELKALRAQLNPHFLFNSLNSISALTSVDAKRAREMCVLLSDFLRKSLRLGAQPEVMLAEELDLLRNYLAIEQIRFGERLKLDWQVQAGVDDIPVPTLLLQPLVENAIKHGISQVMEGGTVSIFAQRQGPWLHLRIENPIDPDLETPKGLGLGQRAVRQRLEGRYGDQARFEVTVQGNLHQSRLTLPIPESTP